MLIRSGDIFDQTRKLSKSCQILNVFSLPNYAGGNPSKICVHVMPIIPAWSRALLVKFREVTPTTPKVIGALMLIFKTNFKCAPLKFFGEPQLGLWCAQASLGESTGRVSKFQVQHPLRAEICSLLKKSIWLGPNSRCPTFWIVDQCLPDLFLRTR